MNNTDDEGMKTMTVSLIKDPIKIARAVAARVCRQALLNMRPHIELNFAINPVDHSEYETCEGHDEAIGISRYCDGSCRPAWTPLIRI